jgi:hypothetical protein
VKKVAFVNEFLTLEEHSVHTGDASAIFYFGTAELLNFFPPKPVARSRFSKLIPEQIQRHSAEFPTKQNRELFPRNREFWCKNREFEPV